VSGLYSAAHMPRARMEIGELAP